MGITSVMAKRRRTNEYTADDSMIVVTMRLYILCHHKRWFCEAVSILYSMSNAADSVVPRDMNSRVVSMLFTRTTFASVVNVGIIEFSTISVILRAVNHVVRMTHEFLPRNVPDSATKSNDGSAIVLSDFPHTW